MTSSGQARTFEGEPPDPFKRVVSPLTTVPGWSVDAIKTDLMRVFNLGFGGDMSSSTIILLVREGWIFQRRSIDKRFDHAYEKFYAGVLKTRKRRPCHPLNSRGSKSRTLWWYIELFFTLFC